ncbi:MAG: DDE-type integrase/transposase/recombinase, partial [Cyanobacteria bacterium J06656_5]
KQNVVADCFSRIFTIDFAPPAVDISSIVDAQKFDCECQEVVQAIVDKKLHKRPSGVSHELWSQRKTLKLVEGALYNRNNQIFVPSKIRIKVLTLCHGLHRGMTSTMASLRETCFWPGYRKAVDAFVNNCRICSSSKPHFLPASNERLLTKAPMEIVALDYIGPLPNCNGYRYILTAIDLFSRYAFAYPVRDLSADTLILTCKEIFSIAGFPDSILSDRGTQFVSQAFLDFLKKFNINKISTNAYSPQSNGCSERFNGTLQTNIQAYLNQVGLSRFYWVKALPSALLSYRTAMHKSTNCRPVDLFFGFSVRGLEVSKGRTQYDNHEFRDQAIIRMHQPSNTCTSHSSPLHLQAGQEVLVRFPSSTKFSEKGRLGKVERMINKRTVRVLFPDDTYVHTAIHRVSLIPRDTEAVDVHARKSPSEFQPSQVRPPLAAGAAEVSDRLVVQSPPQSPTPIPRRSSRPRRPPIRYGIDEEPPLQ